MSIEYSEIGPNLREIRHHVHEHIYEKTKKYFDANLIVACCIPVYKLKSFYYTC